MPDVKAIYHEAGQLLEQARGILDEFEGQEMPDEKAEEYDRLMEAHDKKVADAKRYQRQSSAETFMDDPQNRLETPSGDDDDDEKGDDTPVEVKEAWGRYIKGGERSLTAADRKALQADDDESGGFLVMPRQQVQQLLKTVDDQVWMRGLASVFQVPNADSLGVPTLETDPSDAAWTKELGTGDEDSDLGFGERELRPHPLAKRIKISRTLLRKVPNAESIVRNRLAYKFAVPQENAYMTGDGNQKPLGVYTASSSGISTSRDQTASSTTVIDADELIDTKYSLKAQYLANARWILHRLVLKAIRKLKDGEGQYLWQPGLASDRPASILEVPYVMSEYAPSAIEAGAYIAIIGDFSFYWIADAMNLSVQVLNELYAETNQTGYIGRLETDGMPVLEEAFARLKMAAA